MRAHLLACLMAAAAFCLAGPAAAQSFSEDQRTEIEDIVVDYLLQNPDVVIRAIEAFQAREETLAAARRQDAIHLYHDQLVNSDSSPWVGNAEASVTIVEFFDYNCGFCKRMLDPIADLLETDADIRVVYKEYPILAASSRTAARAALAAGRQDLYHDMHHALMAFNGQLTDDIILAIAEDIGLDIDRLLVDMDAQSITDELTATYALAQDIGVEGTPAFIVGDEFVAGAVGGPTLRQIIEQERQG